MLVHLKGIRRNFSETAFARYREPDLKTKRYLLVVLGKCNFKCKYCYFEGDRERPEIIQESKLVPIEMIEKEVLLALESRYPIRISGGEPTLFEDETIYLLEIIKKYNGFSIVDSNGSNPFILKKFSELCNVLSIDGPKDNKENISEFTNAPLRLCWENPLQTLRVAKEFKCTVEIKTVVFNHTKFEYLEFLRKNIPPNAFWTIKQYQPEIGHFPGDPGHDIKRELNPNYAPLQKEKIFNLVFNLVKDFPDLRKRILIIIGSSRHERNLFKLTSSFEYISCNKKTTFKS